MEPDARVVGFVGRIVRDKGVEDLINCWRIIRDEFPDVHLLVVGPFEPRDPVSSETEKILMNDHRIHLVGSTWETPPLYNAMDLLVLPSHREGFPVVPLEAAAMGLPVVATRIPGCIDAVVDGVTGFLIPPQDPPALCEALRRYLVDPELRRRHGRAGRERVLSDFRPESIWKAACDVYRRVYALKGRLENGT
jgi:glycosyltransferase involved in cell wall biosynthesis